MPSKLRESAGIHDISCTLNRFHLSGDDADLDDLTDEQIEIALALTGRHPVLVEYVTRRQAKKAAPNAE